MQFRFLLLLSICFPFTVNAQSARHRAQIDSLRKVVLTTDSDTGRINALNGMAWRLQYNNTDTALQLLNEALDLASLLSEPDLTKWKAHTHGTLGWLYNTKGDAARALEEYNYSIALWDSLITRTPPSKELNHYISCKTIIIGNLAEAYKQQGNYEKALDNNLAALKLYEQINYKRGMANRLGAIGNLYSAQNDHTRALEYQNRALNIFIELNDQEGVARTQSNVAIAYYQIGDYSEALKHDSISLTLMQQINNQRGVAIALSNMGNIYEAMGDFTTALDCYQRAGEIDQVVGNARGLMIRQANLGSVFTALHRYAEAEQCYTRALVMADSLKNNSAKQEVLLGLSEMYRAMGQYEKALRFYTSYVKLKDSLLEISRDQDMAYKIAGYEYEKKADSLRSAQEKKDIADAAEKKLAEQTLKNTRLVLFGVAGGLFIVVVLAFLIFRNYKEKKKAHFEISRQKDIIEEKNKDILDSIHYAQRIQSALLGSEDLLSKNLKSYFIFFKPKDIVSGDFYYATEKNRNFYLAVCDSTGHGVPGAFMSLLNIAYLNEALNEQKLSSPDTIFNYVRDRLVGSISSGGNQDGMDGTLVQFGNGTIHYASAYNPPFIVRNGIGETLRSDKMPVGKAEITSNFTRHTIAPEPGSMLYLFTDGFSDQFGGEKGKKLKRKALEQKLVSIYHLHPREQQKKLDEFFSEWKGSNEQVDDVLVLGIKL